MKAEDVVAEWIEEGQSVVEDISLTQDAYGSTVLAQRLYSSLHARVSGSTYRFRLPREVFDAGLIADRRAVGNTPFDHRLRRLLQDNDRHTSSLPRIHYGDDAAWVFATSKQGSPQNPARLYVPYGNPSRIVKDLDAKVPSCKWLLKSFTGVKSDDGPVRRADELVVYAAESDINSIANILVESKAQRQKEINVLGPLFSREIGVGVFRGGKGTRAESYGLQCATALGMYLTESSQAAYSSMLRLAKEVYR